MRYFIADVETTGLSATAQIVELAFIEVDENLQILDAKSSLIDPQIPIDAGASAVNGIYDADVVGQPLIADWMAENFPQQGAAVIAHNLAFDSRFLYPHIQVVAGQLCTLALARRYCMGVVNCKLGTLAEHYKLEKGEAHRAAGDVVTTRNLLRVLLDITGRNLTEEFAAAASPVLLHKMPFGKYKGVAFSLVPKGYLQWLSDLPDLPADLRLTVNRFRNV